MDARHRTYHWATTSHLRLMFAPCCDLMNFCINYKLTIYSVCPLPSGWWSGIFWAEVPRNWLDGQTVCYWTFPKLSLSGLTIAADVDKKLLAVDWDVSSLSHMLFVTLKWLSTKTSFSRNTLTWSCEAVTISCASCLLCFAFSPIMKPLLLFTSFTF